MIFATCRKNFLHKFKQRTLLHFVWNFPTCHLKLLQCFTYKENFLEIFKLSRYVWIVRNLDSLYICYIFIQDANDALLESQRKKHAELIHQLKDQLQELESYAYESGEGNMPSNVLLERQRVVMGEWLWKFESWQELI